MRRHWLITGLILASVAAAHGQPIEAVPHTFEAETPARAAEVNANFATLVAEAQRLEAALQAVRGGLPADLTARLEAAEARVGALEAALADRDAQIQQLTQDVQAAQAQAQAARVAVDAATDRLDGVDDVLSASLDALTLRVATLEGADAAADVAREALTARADGLDQRLGVAEASVRTLGDGQRGLQDGVDEVAGALADLIGRQDLPVNVLNVSTVGGADTFPSVQAAFDYLADYRIRPGRLVQVRVQPGVYVSRQPLTIDHPDSERILLRGQGGDPTQVRLVFNGSDGLTVAGGHTFQVEGITFDGEPVEAGEARGRRGAVVADHGVLVLEQGVTFTRFNFGAQLDTGGTIRGTWGGRFVANENAGVTLSDGAFIDLAGAEISHNGEDGVACVRRCYLALNGARIEGNSAAGVIMSDGAVGDLSDAVVDSNTEFGVLAERGSVVNLANATIQRSGFAGVMVAAMSWGNVRQATIGGNNTRNLGTQAQLVAGETAWLAVSNNPDLAGNAPLTRPGIEVQVPLAPISVDND